MTFTGESKLDLTMVCTACIECGIPFAMPKHLDEQRQQDGENIYCPNGHVQVYSEGLRRRERREAAEERGEEDPDAVERRRQKVLELHRQEQAEAKAAEAAQKSVVPIVGQPVQATASEESAEPVRMPKPGTDGRSVCPKCGKPYKLAACLGSHLRRVHGLDPASLHPLKEA